MVKFEDPGINRSFSFNHTHTFKESKANRTVLACNWWFHRSSHIFLFHHIMKMQSNNARCSLSQNERRRWGSMRWNETGEGEPSITWTPLLQPAQHRVSETFWTMRFRLKSIDSHFVNSWSSSCLHSMVRILRIYRSLLLQTCIDTICKWPTPLISSTLQSTMTRESSWHQSPNYRFQIQITCFVLPVQR